MTDIPEWVKKGAFVIIDNRTVAIESVGAKTGRFKAGGYTWRPSKDSAWAVGDWRFSNIPQCYPATPDNLAKLEQRKALAAVKVLLRIEADRILRVERGDDNDAILAEAERIKARNAT